MGGDGSPGFFLGNFFILIFYLCECIDGGATILQRQDSANQNPTSRQISRTDSFNKKPDLNDMDGNTTDFHQKGKCLIFIFQV